MRLQGDYPVAFYTQLKGSANVVASSQFIADAQAGSLPPLVMLWHNAPDDEHPTADVTVGMNTIWQSKPAPPTFGSAISLPPAPNPPVAPNPRPRRPRPPLNRSAM